MIEYCKTIDVRFPTDAIVGENFGLIANNDRSNEGLNLSFSLIFLDFY